MVISEFLAALGLKDNFSGPLDKLFKNGEQKAKKWGSVTAKQFALAGTAVAGFLSAAAAGIIKFGKHLLSSDDEVNKLAKDLGIGRDEAFATKSALDAMGKSLEDIQADPRLLEQFNELKATAEQIRPPDMSEGLNQVRSLGAEFTKVKQTVQMGIQWIGFYFLKYIQQPIEHFKATLKSLNEGLVKNIPKIAEQVGKVLSWVVRLGSRIIQGAQAIWKVVSKLLDMIPDKVKGIGAALMAVNKILKMGTMGKFVALIGAALLLLDDFFTFLEGGDSLLAPIWEPLTNLFKGFTEGGEGALDFFSEDFLPGLLQMIRDGLPKLLTMIGDFLKPALDFGVSFIEGLINGILEALPYLIDMITVILDTLLGALMDALPVILDAGIKIIMALVDGIIKSLPKIVQSVIKLIDTLLKTLVSKLPELIKKGMEMLQSLVKGLLDALPDLIQAALQAIVSFVQTLTEHLPQIIQMGIDLLISLIEGIISAIPDLIGALPQIIVAIVEGLGACLGSIINLGKRIVESIWEGIKGMGSWLKDKFFGFLGGIWDGVVGFFTGGSNGDGGDKTPDPNGGRPPASGRPGGHAEGGIFNKEHVARFAEGDKTEAVVPLTKPKRAMEVLSGVGKFLGLNGGERGGDFSALTPYLEKGVALLEKLSAGMESISAAFSQMQTISSTSNSSVVNNNQQYNVNSKIDVYDTSGNSKTTAKTVDNNQKNLIRGLKGMNV